jgi:hypothetical protein
MPPGVLHRAAEEEFNRICIEIQKEHTITTKPEGGSEHE